MSIFKKTNKLLFMTTLTILLGASFSTQASTVVTDESGQFIGINNLNIESFGFYDVRFHDVWQSEYVYSRDFSVAAGQQLLTAFSDGGEYQGHEIDFFPTNTRGCEASPCLMSTVTNEGVVGSFVNAFFVNAGNDSNDEFGVLGTRSFALAGDPNFSFLEWNSSPDVPVNAVPLPAAAFMFAPALLGFLGLRRKIST